MLRALVYPTYRGWKNHPVTKMWRGFTAGLVGYGLAVCDEWVRRGRADAVAPALLEFTGGVRPDVGRLALDGRLPPWLGLEPLHLSHRSSLLAKDPAHYRLYFPDVPDDLPYLWPPPVFPRWPVRRGHQALTLAAALTELGHTDARAGQVEAVAELVAGRDVTLNWPAGAGSSTVGLLAGLCRPGRTLWISAHSGPTSFTTPPLLDLQPAPVPGLVSKTSPSIARPPTAEDLAAVAVEAAAPAEFVFLRPDALRRRQVRAALHDISLVVLDRVPMRPRIKTAVTLRIV